MSAADQSSSGVNRLVFGTVVRNAPVRNGGELVVLDWTQKSVSNKAPVYPDNPSMDDDPNPRGNTRGCKGIAVVGDNIIAANFHTLQIFDHALNHVRDISHGLMVGTHEVYCDDNRHLWISSTVIDAAIRYDLDTGDATDSFFPREDAKLQEALQLEPAGIDTAADNRRLYLSGDHLKSPSHLHLNAVTVNDGKVYALFHKHGVVCNLTDSTIVLNDSNLIRAHNLLFVEDNLLAINDTYRRTVRIYDLDLGRQVKAFNLLDHPWVRQLERKARMTNLPGKILNKMGLRSDTVSRPVFVRGLAHRGDRLFVGISPAAILCLNWRTGILEDHYQYSSDPRVCVHGLTVLD